MTTSSKTNRFQFGLRTLMAVCFFAAVGTWVYQWTRWPARTIAQFAELIRTEQYEKANARLSYENNYVVSPDDLIHRVHIARHVCLNFKPQRRSFADLVHGRQTFKPPGNQSVYVDTGKVRAHWLIESLTLERGTIRFNWIGPADSTVKLENGEWVQSEMPNW